MKAAILLANRSTNPKYVNSSGVTANSGGTVQYLTEGSMKFARITTAASASDVTLTDFIDAAIGVQYTASIMVRAVSSSFSVQPQWRHRSGTWLAQANPSAALTMGVWTSVSRSRVAVQASESLGFNVPANSVFDIGFHSNFDTDFQPDYRDGDSPGWSWSGTANASSSSGPYFADKTLNVYGAKNLLLNPSAEGSLAGIGGFWPSESIRTITTEEKYVGDSCLKVETTPVSSSVIGAIFSAAIPPSPAYYPVGVQYYARAMLKGVAGRQYSVSIRLESTVNASLAFKFVTATGDWQEVTTSLVPTAAQAPGRLYRVNVEVLSRDNMSLGPQTFYVDAVSLSFSDVPYFDGDSDNAEWTGTANNSASVLKQFAPAQVRSYDGTNWVAG